MGYDYEKAQDMADMAGALYGSMGGADPQDGDLFDTVGMDIYGRTKPPQDDVFDTPDQFDTTETAPAPVVKKSDPLRPETKRGRYYLPNPEHGKTAGFQRVTNFTKLTEDTYHLERWKQRNVILGVARLLVEGRLKLNELVKSDVKEDKQRLNNIAETAMDVAEAYKNADEGTALHTSTELVDLDDGNLNRAPEHHRRKVRLYLDALAAHGLTVVPGMIERVTVSMRYEVAGTFDRIFRLPDGSMVIGDLKTGDSLDFAEKSIASQLQSYQDGVNTHGVFDGQRYDTSIKVREDFGIVIHLPSTRNEVSVLRVPLADGRRINEANLMVKRERRLKAPLTTFSADEYAMTQDARDQHWLERLNAAYTVEEALDVKTVAESFGQWNERLAGQARIIAAGLPREMGS